MEARLLVRRVEHGGLVAGLGRRGNRGCEVELETIGDLVLDLDLRLEHVRGVPGAGEGQAVLFVGHLGLEVAGDEGGVGGTVSSDLEDDI